MLRNLNRVYSTGRVCGTPKTGVLGSLIPSSGTNGPGYAYNDLTLPADADEEICGRITAWPSAGELFAWEDTSFVFSGAPDGSYSFEYQLEVGGIARGAPATVALNVGSGATTINGIVGSATAAGSQASLNISINAQVGDAIAGGMSASVGTIVATTVGNATADGVVAGIISTPSGATLACTVGDASAFGLAATISTNSVISARVGVAIASGALSGISPNLDSVLANPENTIPGASRVRSLGALDTTKAAFEMNFTPKRASETEVLSVDYSAVLSAGETITSATWSNAVVSGADANPSAMISGGASINGSTVSQLITGGISGVTYAPTCAATTNSGQTIVLPVPGTGHLAVKG